MPSLLSNDSPTSPSLAEKVQAILDNENLTGGDSGGDSEQRSAAAAVTGMNVEGRAVRVAIPLGKRRGQQLQITLVAQFFMSDANRCRHISNATPRFHERSSR